MKDLLKFLLRKDSLLQSGFILSAVGLLTQAFNYLFQAVISPQLGGKEGEFALVQGCIAFIGLLGMPSAIITQALTHYIAKFNYSGDDARLDGLLAGCRRFLLYTTIFGCLIAVVLIQPLGHYFKIPRATLTLISLACVVCGLWNTYVTMLCQGLGWFRRLAFISLLGAICRMLFALPTTHVWHVAECGVLASLVALAPNLILLYWRKNFPRHCEKPVSPWDAVLVKYLLVSGAYIFGCYCFAQADLLIAGKYFSDDKAVYDAYCSAGLLPRALPMAAGPLLIVLFTYRSGRQHGEDLGEQMKMFGIYAVGLIGGAIVLYFLRDFCLGLLGRNTPQADAMLGPIALTMVFTGLIQSIASWSLASRWNVISIIYGLLGLVYWLVLLRFGTTPSAMLHYMPITLGAAFVVLLIVWLATMWRTQGGVKSET